MNDTEDSVERGRGYGPTSAQQVAEGDKREAEILTVVTLLETDGEILESANVSQLDASSDATNEDGNRELGGVKYIGQRSSDCQRSTRIEVSPRGGGGLRVSGNEGLLETSIDGLRGGDCSRSRRVILQGLDQYQKLL